MKNVLTLICGAPGSGKSTLAKALVSAGYADKNYEADMYMVDESGAYNFKPEKLGYCHKKCYDKVKNSLLLGLNVIQSNTNIKPGERQVYIDLAKEVGAKVQIIRVDGNFGSIHGVPWDKVESMRNSLESGWGKEKNL